MGPPRGRRAGKIPHPSVSPVFNTPAYQETGASWVHTILAGPPGKTEGMVHRRGHLGGIWPASSGHNPGSQDRWDHLRKKQRRHGPSQPTWLSLSTTAALFRNPSLHRAGLAWPISGHCSGQALPSFCQVSEAGSKQLQVLWELPCPIYSSQPRFQA